MRDRLPLLTIGPAAKGAIMATVLVAADVHFVQALVIAAVSATLTGIYGLIAAHMAVKAQRETQHRLQRLEDRQKDIGGAVGVTHRRTDPGPIDPEAIIPPT